MPSETFKLEEVVDSLSVISRIIFNRLKCMECNQCEPCGAEFMKALQVLSHSGHSGHGRAAGST